MHLGTLVLENFKAFRERQEIPFAPITLIFGPNSAGKSSILQAIQLLRQSALHPSPDGALVTSDGPIVGLGPFREFVSDHDATRVCEIGPLFVDPDGWFLYYPREGGGAFSGGSGLGFRIDGTEGRTRLAEMVGYLDGREAFAYPRHVPGSNPIDAMFARGDRREWGSPDRSGLRIRDPRVVPVHPRWAAIAEGWFDRREDFVLAMGHAIGELRAMLASGKLEDFRDRSDIDHDDDEPVSLVTVEEVKKALRESDGEPNREPSMAELWCRWFVQSGFETLRSDIPTDRHIDRLERSLEDFARLDLEGYIDVVRRTGGGERWLDGLRFSARPPWTGHPLSELAAFYAYFTGDGYTADFTGSEWLPHLEKLCGEMSDALHSWLSRSTYLGPQRAYPERFQFSRTNAAPDEPILGDGANVLDLLASDPEARELTNRYLQSFGMGYRVEVLFDFGELAAGLWGPAERALAARGIADRAIVRLIDTRTDDTDVDVRDVGFGVSQSLPVIVACCRKRGTVMVEQPELHLHPRLQAQLGDLFLDAKNRGNQVIAETHSQHLILRLQRHIRERRLAPEDLSVVYVERGVGGSEAIPLRMDERGDFIDDWPGGFFEETYRELFGGGESTGFGGGR